MDQQKIIQELQLFRSSVSNRDEQELFSHLSNQVSLRSYLSMAQEIRGILGAEKYLLDWGAGFGQMTLILKHLGVDVTAYDVDKKNDRLFTLVGTPLVIGKDQTKLPFPDNQYDAVLSCGALEHVENDAESLAELHRVLKPGGYLFIYNLPYRYSPSEFYSTLRGTSVHPVKYTGTQLAKLLTDANFTTQRLAFQNGIPKNLSGPLFFLRPLYNRWPEFFLTLDRWVVNIPVLSHVLSNSLMAIAKK